MPQDQQALQTDDTGNSVDSGAAYRLLLARTEAQSLLREFPRALVERLRRSWLRLFDRQSRRPRPVPQPLIDARDAAQNADHRLGLFDLLAVAVDDHRSAWRSPASPLRPAADRLSALQPANALLVVKLTHTLVWAFFAGLIVTIPLASIQGKHALAAWSAAAVAGEVLVLAANGFRCPLTAIAARYTDDRRDNFDIYLPQWLARHNKLIFGTLYLAGMAFAVVRWALAGE